MNLFILNASEAVEKRAKIDLRVSTGYEKARELAIALLEHAYAPSSEGPDNFVLALQDYSDRNTSSLREMLDCTMELIASVEVDHDSPVVEVTIGFHSLSHECKKPIAVLAARFNGVLLVRSTFEVVKQ